MASLRTHILKVLFRLAVTAILLIWVFRQVDPDQFVQAAKVVRWSYVLIVWGLTVLYFWLNAVRLQLILRQQGCGPGVHAAFRASAVTALYAMVLPGILSSGVKWYVLKRDTGQGGRVFSGLVYNQISGILVCVMFASVALMATNPYAVTASDRAGNWVLPAVCGGLLAGSVLLCGMLLSPRVGGRVVGAASRVAGWMPRWFAGKAQHVLCQIATFQSAPVRFHIAIGVLTLLANCGLGVLIFLFAGWAAHVDAPIGVFVWLFGVVHLLARIPISVANLGVREVTLVTGLGIYGVPESSALLMSAIFFSALVLMAGIGAAYQLAWVGHGVNEGTKSGETVT